MDRKYNPDDYDEVLAEYMKRAYTYHDEGNMLYYDSMCGKITMETKIQWKNGAISRQEAEDIKSYFWSYAE